MDLVDLSRTDGYLQYNLKVDTWWVKDNFFDKYQIVLYNNTLEKAEPPSVNWEEINFPVEMTFKISEDIRYSTLVRFGY